MAWGEVDSWLEGQSNEHLYQRLLDDSRDANSRNARRKKIVRPSDMPWEMSRQGLLKHLINENMNTRMETIDAYMQILPPGSRSGKHRHLAENASMFWKVVVMMSIRTPMLRSPMYSHGRSIPR